MPLLNSMALEVTSVLSGGSFSFHSQFNNFSVDDHMCTQFGKHWPCPHCLWQRKKITIWMRLVCLTCPTKLDIAQGKICGHKIQNDRLTFALVGNTTYTHQLKPMIMYKSLCPRCFGRSLSTIYLWWFANQTTLMTSNIFKSWMMSLKVHFKSQKWKVFVFMDHHATHSLSMLVGVNHLDFQPCSWAILLLFFYHLMLQVWCNP